MNAIHKPMSLWDDTSTETVRTRNDGVKDTVDVVIVGAGFTGLSAAIHCTENGMSCHVIEAEHVGYGGSGRNTGLVNAAAWLPPQDVIKQLGAEAGKKFVDIFSDAPSFVFGLIKKYNIECEVTNTGTIHAAHGKSGFVDLQYRKSEWDRLGAPVDLLSADETAELTGTRRFYGALVDKRAGTINPMGYCRGLARAALQNGAKLTTNCRVHNVIKENDGWRIITSNGDLRAKYVILGTNAYTDKLWPGLSQTFTRINYFNCATVPLGERIRYILPQRQGLWDTGKIMFSLRRDKYDRLIIGSMGRTHGNRKSGITKRWASAQLKRLFPDLGPVEFENIWYGEIAMTPTHLPGVHQLDRNLYTSIGYNGRGITTGTIFGKALADMISSSSPDGLPLPITQMAKVSTGPFMSTVYKSIFSANQILKSTLN
ncbi:FAD-binding oxidoreductase [bacterium]|nr:FAD-binding oxidoreductase [bacterium]